MRLHNRQVKAEFWTDPDLLQLPRDARTFYHGLWHCSEDSACLEESPFTLKLLLFPSPVDSDITVQHLASWIAELITMRKLVRYEVKGKQYLYLTKFHKHQTLRNPGASEVPLPPWLKWLEPGEENGKRVPGRYATLYDPFDDDVEGPNASSQTPTEAVPTGYDCGTDLVPDPYQPGTGSKVREGKVSKDKRSLKDICASDDARDCSDELAETVSEVPPSSVEAPKVTAEPGTPQDSLFAEFWSAYPKKRSKGQAQKAWMKLKPCPPLFSSIMSGLARARESPDWRKDNGRYIPHPATWLNASGWEDEYEEVQTDGRSGPTKAGPRPGKWDEFVINNPK